MTREQAESILTFEQQERCAEIGTVWGREEADTWRDQHSNTPDRPLPAWTMGTYCGDLNEFGEHGSIERDAADLLIDLAARAAWDEEREAETKGESR